MANPVFRVLATLATLGVALVLTSPAARATAPAAEASVATCPALLQHRFPRLQDEKEQALCQYRGKVLLVVNTASFCGFTGQYEGLEKLYARYKDQGLVVLGFPSNDFNQESADNKKIAEFCSNTFGVKFPMFTRTRVTGAQAAPFFRQLSEKTGQAPRWNFYKYLVGRNGEPIEAYSSMTSPDDRKLVQAIEKQLALAAPAR